MIFDNKTRAIYKKPLFLQIKKATHRLKNLAFLVKNAVIIVCIGIARTRREKHKVNQRSYSPNDNGCIVANNQMK